MQQASVAIPRKGQQGQGQGQQGQGQQGPAMWFLQPCGIVNFVDISVAEPSLLPLPGRARGFSLNVPAASFEAMLDRASQHPGYSPRSWDVREIRSMDACISFEASERVQQQQQQQQQQGQQGQGQQGPKLRVYRNVLQDAMVLPGTSILVRRYHRTLLPLPAFPHDRPVDSVCRARRLKLRVNRSAALVFESIAEEEQGSGSGRGSTAQRRVRIEVDLGMLSAAAAARGPPPDNAGSSLRDLNRTVENTIQVVMLGMRPKVAQTQRERL